MSIFSTKNIVPGNIVYARNRPGSTFIVEKIHECNAAFPHFTCTDIVTGDSYVFAKLELSLKPIKVTEEED
jgi:hypothetical protein